MDINFSNIFKEIIENSKKEAQLHNSKVIGPEHLLLSLLSVPDCKAVALVQQSINGVSIDELRSTLNNEVPIESEPIVPDKNCAVCQTNPSMNIPCRFRQLYLLLCS